MANQFSRTELLLGKDAMDKLSKARVAVFGIGGVGGYAVEALARSGIGQLDLIDNDVIAESNINRQLIALNSTVGMAKVDAAEQRVLDINPNCIVRKHKIFYMPETENQFDFFEYDYIIDAIDTVTGKIALAVNANTANTPIISSMGTGNKIDATMFEVTDIYKTSVCPLAKVMRYELRKRNIKKLKVVYSKEPARKILANTAEDCSSSRNIPASCAFVPSVAGLILGGEVIKDLIK